MSDRGALRRLLHEPSALLAATVLAAIVIACLLAPVYASEIAHTGPDATHVTETIAVSGKRLEVVSPTGVPIGPTWSARFLLGADPNGRDVAVRLLYGGRPSLLYAAVVTGVAVVVGVPLGLLAGYAGHRTDRTLLPHAEIEPHAAEKRHRLCHGFWNNPCQQ